MCKNIIYAVFSLSSPQLLMLSPLLLSTHNIRWIQSDSISIWIAVVVRKINGDCLNANRVLPYIPAIWIIIIFVCCIHIIWGLTEWNWMKNTTEKKRKMLFIALGIENFNTMVNRFIFRNYAGNNNTLLKSLS